MKVLEYQGQNVYTHVKNHATVEDLQKANTELGMIVDAYFFEYTGTYVERKNFDEKAIEKGKRGLMIDVKHASGGQASLGIVGLENITKFLDETKTSKDELFYLSGQEVITYNINVIGAMLGFSIGKQMLGASINNNKK